MKQRLIGLLVVAGALLSIDAMAQGKVYVISEEGRRIYGSKLTANANGDLELTMRDGRAKQKFRKGNYKGAYIPIPQEVRKLQAAFSQGAFDHIDKNAEDAVKRYGYLGWGDMIMIIRAKVALDRGNPQEALEFLKRGRQYNLMHAALWRGTVAETYVDLEQYDKAEKWLDGLLKRVDDIGQAAALFNLKGEMRAKQGREKEAVLEYLKVVLLLDKQEAGTKYKQARDNVVKLLKEMNDSRYKEFEQM